MRDKIVAITSFAVVVGLIGFGLWHGPEKKPGDFYVQAASWAVELGEQTDKFPLVFTNNTGKAMEHVVLWISPASANLNANDDRYWSLDKANRPIAAYTQGNTGLKRAVPLGDYFVEINTTDELFVQTLSLYIETGRLKQRVRVVNRETKKIVFEKTLE